MKRKIAYFILCFTLFISLIPLVKYFLKEQKDKEVIHKIQEVVKQDNTDFADLKAINEDLVAILYVEGTDIYLPIVQTTDNDFYLNHNFYKKYDEYGCPFMDYQANADFSNRNTFVYGHNVLAGNEMFSFLKNYMNESYVREHPYINIKTENAEYRVLIFSGYTSQQNSESYQPNINDDSSFQNYINVIQSKSNYQLGIEPTISDHILSLYTCALDGITHYSQLSSNTNRYFVHAILEEISTKK